MLFDFQLAVDSLPFVLEGLWLTLIIALASFTLSVVFGLFFALMKMSSFRLLNGIAHIYISFFRGVPALVVLFYIYFGLPIIGYDISPLSSAITGLSLTSTAYSAEIIRSAIISIDKGQWEAAQSLGLNYLQILKWIILPQTFRVVLPPLSNVLLDLIKGTSLAAMITVPEVFQKAKIVGGAQFDYLTMYALVAVIYWVICTSFGIMQDKLEKSIKY